MRIFLEKIKKSISKYHGRFEEYETLVDRLVDIGKEVINSENKQEDDVKTRKNKENKEYRYHKW